MAQVCVDKGNPDPKGRGRKVTDLRGNPMTAEPPTRIFEALLLSMIALLLIQFVFIGESKCKITTEQYS